MAEVTLQKAKWVIRHLRVATDEGSWLVEYRGYYFGSEAVFVDGRLAQEKPSVWGMVPRFEFPVGPHQAVLLLEFTRMWTVFWPKISSLTLELDGEVVYREGHELPRASARFS
jgi:hypothetical protein